MAGVFLDDGGKIICRVVGGINFLRGVGAFDDAGQRRVVTAQCYSLIEDFFVEKPMPRFINHSKPIASTLSKIFCRSIFLEFS
jgi:hypothetical protein